MVCDSTIRSTLKVPRTFTSKAVARILIALQQPEGGEVKHAIGAFESGVELVGLANVTAGLEDRDARGSRSASSRFARTPR